MTLAKKISKKDIAITGATGLCAGASIRTPFGARRVDLLSKGDLVVTRDSGLQPVIHIWSRKLTEAEITADPSLAPVALSPRAIGPMMPQKTLRVGGAQRLLIPGWRLQDEDDSTCCLVPARDVDGVSLGSNAPAEETEYFNIVFATPQVFAVNGLPVESYTLDTETRKITPKEVQKDLRKLFPKSKQAEQPCPLAKYKRRHRASYTPDYA